MTCALWQVTNILEAQINSYTHDIKVNKPDCVNSFNAIMDTDNVIRATCASCGVCRCVSKVVGDKEPTSLEFEFPYMNVEGQKLLEVNKELIEEYNAIPEVYKPAFSYFQGSNGRYYHLHPEFVEETPWSGVRGVVDAVVCGVGKITQPLTGESLDVMVHRARVCRKCHTAFVKEKRVPAMSLADGVNLGNPQRIGLEPLNMIERTLIAQMRTDLQIVKCNAPDKYTRADSSYQSGLRGHVITFPHDGPEVLADSLPNIKGAMESIKVVFVGPDNMEERFRKSVLASGRFRVDVDKVYKWLEALVILHRGYVATY